MRGFAIFAMALGLAGFVPARADDACQLKRYASIPLAGGSTSEFLLEVSIDGEPAKMVLSTGSWLTTLTEGFVKRKGLREFEVRPWGTGLKGKPLASATHVGELKLGAIVSRDRDFPVVPMGGDGADGKMVGTFGADYLSNYDVEVDPAGGVVNFYFHDHCPGKVVYWASEYFRVPMYVEGNKQASVDIEIDGKTVRALIDSGADKTMMRLAVARRLFGVSDDAADVSPSDPIHGADGMTKADSFLHTFETLNFGGITLRNPKILIADYGANRSSASMGGRLSRDEDDAAVNIGRALLSKLHLFIAYSEPALYFTLAEPPKAAGR